MEKGHLKQVVVFLLSALMLAGVCINSSKAGSIDIYEQQKLTSHLLVNLFMEQIAKNGLTIFGHELDPSDLHSHHVAYIHNTASDNLKVELCFTLAEPIAVPETDDFYVNKITVEMDKDGRIIEISSHVIPVDQNPQNPD